MIKRDQLGIAVVDCGDVVVLPIDALGDIWLENHRLDNADDYERMEEWITSIAGVRGELRADGRYGVDRVTVVTDEYKVSDGVLIGCPEDQSLRLLRQDEQDSEEFTEPLIQSGTSIDEAFALYAKYLKENDE